ncbi:glycosyltransferase family 4 protein [Caldimonas thermodepolymerans]|uniref:Glycosyltransferase involved in cell wall biosynthesis n=1 Tax=Caldimonas thermodepolymerans TaxID=215580 RepID=A0AA46DCJ3_9BURK|nr:glycosyltransferase family 4 protein [Caldimonas thermodepolymerans]TCP06337.1 glycosyltransferase involved in cell wall biosynthesis [Caldimonas thermodepolymerans]UZG49094.1 glycosyltransferase family 4 protein [Caldimonas thermodepolymerans]
MSSVPEVVIVQRRLTNYRVPLFERMRTLMSQRGMKLRLLHGDPTPVEATKRDGGQVGWAEHLPTRYLAGGRLCWQNFGPRVRDADLVIVTQENKLLYNLVALTVRRPPRIAFWGHGGNLQSDRPDGWKERFKRWTTRRVDWWFAYTDLSADLVQAQGYAPERITVLDNAVDTQELIEWRRQIDATAVEAARAKLGLTGHHVGVFVGSLYADKRIDFLLQAAGEIRRRVPDFELLIVGSGPLAPMVEQHAARHPWVHYLGVRTGRDKVEVVALAQVMLNPGLVGLGVLDAFACGVPMLTTDCRLHSPEIAYLRHGHNGLMTPDTLHDYVDAAVMLLTRPEVAQRLRQGCADAAGRYTVENMARRFTEGIGRCLDAPRLGETAPEWKT